MDHDAELRNACFLALDALRAQLGDDLPYAGALDRRFSFRGRQIPFLNYQKGIYRAAAQNGPAALSVVTSHSSPYDDEEVSDGFLYAYRDGPVDQHDNRALRAAFDLGVPIVYFVGMNPGRYQALYPVYVMQDKPSERKVLLSPGDVDTVGPTPIATRADDQLQRRYLVREVRVRLHQARFRGVVLPAYQDRCAICRLKERRLLDAAHIVADREPAGAAAVTNGLSLCTIHHRAFDQDLVGVAPDYRVHVSRSLRDEDDGPMLELLKGFHGAQIVVPRSARRRPDRNRLDHRFERFLERS